MLAGRCRLLYLYRRLLSPRLNRRNADLRQLRGPLCLQTWVYGFEGF